MPVRRVFEFETRKGGTDSVAVGSAHFEHTYRLLLPDGKVKHMHSVARALQGESGNREFVGAVSDVTECKKAEKKLHEQEAELRQILDLTPQHVHVLTTDARLVYTNEIALKFHGFTLHD